MQAFCGTDIKEWYSRTATSQSVAWVADLVATFKSSFPKVWLLLLPGGLVVCFSPQNKTPYEQCARARSFNALSSLCSD